MHPLVIQAIGLVGLGLNSLSFQKDKRSFTLIVQTLGSIAYVVHFALLTAWTGAAMNALATVRAYTFNLRETKRWIDKPVFLYLMIVAFWIAGVLTWEGWISLLPLAAMTVTSFGIWSTNTKHIRWLFFAGRPFWIVYNIIVGSWAGLASEALIVSSLVTAIYRFDIRGEKEKSKDD